MRRGLQNQCLIFTLLMAMAYAYIHYVEFYPCETFRNTGVHQSIAGVHGKCLISYDSVPHKVKSLSVRGSGYTVNGDEDQKKVNQNCFMTFWGMTHFMFHAIIGFFCPDLFWPAFTVGVGWELYEYKALDCHDTLDIVFNTAGFYAGKALGRSCC